MSTHVSGVNPRMLVWARERAGLSVVEVAQTVRTTVDVIESWESGASAPTYQQLEKLAYRVYKRPIALFFFPEPPAEPTPEHAFRTLPHFEVDTLAPDTRWRIRRALFLQQALRELNGGRNPASRNVLTEVRVVQPLNAEQTAREVRGVLGVELTRQKTEWKDDEQAFKGWRAAVERAGVFVFKDTFKQQDVSGFCLYDTEFPLIYVNNGTSFTRQIFTIFHELAHLLVATSGVTKRNDRYIQQLAGRERAIEVFCNQFAAEVLLPRAEFEKLHVQLPPSDDHIEHIADTYKVSREMVLRCFLNAGYVSSQFYERKAQEWTADYERHRTRRRGSDYYRTRASYLGQRYLSLAFAKYYEGALSIEELADYLDVPVRNVPRLEQMMLTSRETF